MPLLCNIGILDAIQRILWLLQQMWIGHEVIGEISSSSMLLFGLGYPNSEYFEVGFFSGKFGKIRNWISMRLEN